MIVGLIFRQSTSYSNVLKNDCLWPLSERLAVLDMLIRMRPLRARRGNPHRHSARRARSDEYSLAVGVASERFSERDA
jgi:hypothetical protein